MTLAFWTCSRLKLLTSTSTLFKILQQRCGSYSGRAEDDSQPASWSDSSPDEPRLCFVCCLLVQILLQCSVSTFTPNQVRASPCLILQWAKHVSFLFFFLCFIFRRCCISALDLFNGVKQRFKGEICAGSSKRLCLSHPQRSSAL